MSISDVLQVVATEDATVVGVLLMVAIAQAIAIIFLWRSTRQKDAEMAALAERFHAEAKEIVARMQDELDEHVGRFADLADRYEKLATEVTARFNVLIGQMADRVFGRQDPDHQGVPGRKDRDER